MSELYIPKEVGYLESYTAYLRDGHDHSTVMADDQYLLSLLKQLVSRNTVNDPDRGIRPSPECARFLSEILAKGGLKTETLEREGVYSIVARMGEGSPRALFMAHYDTVPVVESEWTKPPFELTVEEHRAYGRGALDDKVNVAALIKTCLELRQLSSKGSFIFAFTGDEETSGPNGASLVAETLQKQSQMPDYVVNGDGSGVQIITRRRNRFTAIVEMGQTKSERKGRASSERFQTTARGRHPAYFVPGIDTHCLLEASRLLRDDPNLFARSLGGGFVKANVLPSNCELGLLREDPGGEKGTIDESLTELIRALVPLTRVAVRSEFSEYGVTITPNVLKEEQGRITLALVVRVMTNDSSVVRDSLQKVIDECLPGAKLKVEGGMGCLNTPKDSPLVNCGLESLEELGLREQTAEKEGASDSRYFSKLGISCFDFGPLGGNTHGPDEYVDLASANLLPRFYGGVARRILGLEKPETRSRTIAPL